VQYGQAGHSDAYFCATTEAATGIARGGGRQFTGQSHTQTARAWRRERRAAPRGNSAHMTDLAAPPRKARSRATIALVPSALTVESPRLHRTEAELRESVRPRLFIASSSEGLDVARIIQLQLERDADSILWTDAVFAPTEYALESLERQLDTVDCGVFVLTPDDLTRARGAQKRSPRDNVIFELGLFAGRLGRRRAVIILPRGVGLKLPSDLLGVNTVTYEHSAIPDLATSALAPACTLIRQYLARLPLQRPYVSWEDTCALTRRLAGLLRRSPRSGGFSFDIIVGLSRGGIIIADLLSRAYGGTIPPVCLLADRHSSFPNTTFSLPTNWINLHVLELLRDHAVRNILLVDDITREVTTVVGAKSFLVQNLPDKNVRSAILMAPSMAEGKIDYIARIVDTRLTRTAFSLVED
jgi:predicted nucleotide-binding protein/hypoxanthine phosphoribosyltransferase